jgi:hypothetical protein
VALQIEWLEFGIELTKVAETHKIACVQKSQIPLKTLTAKVKPPDSRMSMKSAKTRNSKYSSY